MSHEERAYEAAFLADREERYREGLKEALGNRACGHPMADHTFQGWVCTTCGCEVPRFPEPRTWDEGTSHD